ncbi:hypothetical protein PITCH_A420044 [uncultured Desulfobacterium sp.]|uniref:Uncharacterized protein n=1 Tax=uncultured Desulfobacterium sp. TaxID=201089 RepID=A0A445N074_9BACT|nr:hypothetical protein PITCH_A420044 [uncultured Desulfobacterium sp.]
MSCRNFSVFSQCAFFTDQFHLDSGTEKMDIGQIRFFVWERHGIGCTV